MPYAAFSTSSERMQLDVESETVFSTADTYGHPDSQGATAKEFSSQVDAKGANYDALSSIYGNGFVADGLPDDPRDSFVLDK